MRQDLPVAIYYIAIRHYDFNGSFSGIRVHQSRLMPSPGVIMRFLPRSAGMVSDILEDSKASTIDFKTRATAFELPVISELYIPGSPKKT